ncbi:MAG: hypothetical protein ACE5F4_01930 [Candidatus Paceibacteria bacterium]
MNKKMMPVMLVMMLIILGGLFFAYSGFSMHRQVVVDEAVFHQNLENYFIISKAERDGAATGSALNAQLVEIQKAPSDLLRLKLVGVGNILVGIFFLLFGILIALMMMPVRLAKIIAKQQSRLR